MASNTIKVVDGTGIQLLEQLNLINPALASMQYGSTDPSVGGYAVSGMWWADTGNNLVKQRNSANTAWITQGTVDSNGAITWNNANSAVSATTATTATSATKDGNNNVIASTYVPLSGGTLTGAINLANNTWNVLGDDVMIGDCNINGCMGVKGNNATTGIAMYQYGSTSNYATFKYDGTNFIPSVTIKGTCTNATNASLASSATYATTAGNSNALGGYTYSQVIANAGSITASSYGTNGYVKFSSGLLIQWIEYKKVNDDTGGHTISLPTSFSNTNYGAMGIYITDDNITLSLHLEIQTKNTGSFTIGNYGSVANAIFIGN